MRRESSTPTAAGRALGGLMRGILNHPLHLECLGVLASASPVAALRYAALSGRVVHGFAREPSAADVKALLDDLPLRRCRAIARQIAVRDHKNTALKCLARRKGVEALIPLVRCRGEDLLHAGEPAILCFLHMGPAFAVAAGLAQLDLPCLMIAHVGSRTRFPPNVEVWSTKTLREGSALFLKRGVERIRQGGLVAMAMDGQRGEGELAASMLGRALPFRRGLSVLHHVTGAPVIPVTGEWSRKGGITFTVHSPFNIPDSEPTTKGGSEAALMHEAVKWMENQIRLRPEDLTPSSLRRYILAPREMES